MDSQTRVLLIGGSSHAGKSTVAQALAQRLGWSCVSTDSLARHPGRPWPSPRGPVPPHVAQHYLELSDDELLASVLSHYRNMWPLAVDRVKGVLGAPGEGLVLEGSALWPDLVVALQAPQVSAVWLGGSPELFRERMHRESRYCEADPTGRALVDRFLERTCRYDLAMRDVVAHLGLPLVQPGPAAGVDEVAQACLDQARPVVSS